MKLGLERAGLSLFFIMLVLTTSGCVNSSQDTASPSNIINSSTHYPLILYTEEQPPFNYINERGQVAGRSTEIIKEIMKRQGIQSPIVMGKWTDGYNTVLKTSNTAIYSTIRTHQRESMFRWVGPIAELQYAFYVRSDSVVTATSVLDLRNYGRIAVVRNDAREQYLRALNITNILPFDEDSDCIRALSSGEAEFWLGTKDISTQNAKKQEEKIYEFRILDLPPISQRLYIAFNRKTPDTVVQEWQQTLDGMKYDGTYDLIQSRYMPYICSWVRCIP